MQLVSFLLQAWVSSRVSARQITMSLAISVRRPQRAWAGNWPICFGVIANYFATSVIVFTHRASLNISK